MAEQKPAPTSLVQQVAMCGAGGVLITWAAPWLLHRTAWQGPLVAAVAAIITLVVAVAVFAERRRRVREDLAAALTPLLGREKPPRELLQVRRRRGRIRELQIRYPATFDDRREENRVEVRHIISTRIGYPVDATWQREHLKVVFRVHRDRQHGHLKDSDVPSDVYEVAGQKEVHERASDVVRSILGQSARVHISFPEGSVAPESINVVYTTTPRDLSAPFRQKVLQQVQHKIPGDWQDIWDFEDNVVRFVPRPIFPSEIAYPMAESMEYGLLPYAVNENGATQYWHLGSRSPHMLAVGPTGSGKTVLIRNMVLGAVMQGIPVVLMDPKRTEYLDFAGLPGVTLVTDTREIATAIEESSDWMDARYQEIETGTVRSGEHRKVLLISDEFATFRARVNQLWQQEKREKQLKNAPRHHPCLEKWQDIVLMARTAQMHVVVGLQRPDADIVQGILRDSLRMRIGLDQHTPETAQMLWNSSRVGTRLPSIQGRGIATTPDGLQEVQVMRVVPPAAGGSDADAQLWEHVLQRAADPAVWEAVPLLPPGLQRLRDQRRAGRGAAGAMSLSTSTPALSSLPSPGVDPEQQDDAGDAAESAAALAVPVDVGDLVEGDAVWVEDETGIPLQATVTAVESPDGEEAALEVTLLLEDGTEEVRPFSWDETLSRRELSS